MDDVGPGLLVVLELEKTALLAFQEQIIERAETVGPLVEPGMLAFDRLFHQRTADRIIFAALLQALS